MSWYLFKTTIHRIYQVCTLSSLHASTHYTFSMHLLDTPSQYIFSICLLNIPSQYTISTPHHITSHHTTPHHTTPHHTTPSQPTSTRWYRAPECLLTDGYYGPEMDLWGAGCVMFEITRYITIHDNTIQYSTVHYNTVHHNTIHANTIQYNTIQYKKNYVRQYNIIHYGTRQYGTIHDSRRSHRPILLFTPSH